MARVKPDTDRAVAVRAVMEETGFDEAMAAFIVALERGETYGDVVSVGPMTPDERRRIGLDIVVGEEAELDLDDDDDANDDDQS